MSDDKLLGEWYTKQDGPPTVPSGDAARAASETPLSANPTALEVRARFDELMDAMDQHYEQGIWDAPIVAWYIAQEVRAAVLRARPPSAEPGAAAGPDGYRLCAICGGRSAVDKSYPCRPCGSRGVVVGRPDGTCPVPYCVRRLGHSGRHSDLGASARSRKGEANVGDLRSGAPGRAAPKGTEPTCAECGHGAGDHCRGVCELPCLCRQFVEATDG